MHDRVHVLVRHNRLSAGLSVYSRCGWERHRFYGDIYLAIEQREIAGYV